MRGRRRPVLEAISDTSLLWLLLLVALALQLAAQSGLELPLLARTSVWRLGQSPWAVAGIAVAVLVATFSLAACQRLPHRAFFIAGALTGLGIAFFVTFDPGTGAAFAATSGGLYRKLASAAKGST